jgi:aquaporin Z
MEPKLPRACVIELVGTFGLILFSAGLVCINQTTTPLGHAAGTAPLTLHQPGVFGVALGQGLVLAVMLALTVPVSGGYLNPAITLMLWVFNRLETPRAAWFIGCQFLGGLLAAVCLRYSFHLELLQVAQFGAPHINPLAYPALEAGRDGRMSGQVAGTLMELVLTFFLVFAIFGMAGTDSFKLGLVTGMMMTACSLFGFPLTGAALNPARWLGPTIMEAFGPTEASARPWADTLVYLAGPIIGSLLGGAFVFYVYRPAEDASKPNTPASAGRPSSAEATAIKVKK